MEAFYALAGEDYRRLALALDWAGELSRRSAAAGGRELRLLDVACGSGKFPSALLRHAGLSQVPGLAVRYDLLDPSAFSLAEARSVLVPPFLGGADHLCTLQELARPEDPWDVVWATHALYALPPEELRAGLVAFVDALAPGGLGVVAHATSASHYLRFYDAWRAGLRPATPYVSAEEVAVVLGGQGVDLTTRLLHYESSASARPGETAVVEGYLQRCAFDDSVGLAAMLADAHVGPYLRDCLAADGSAYTFWHEVALMTFTASS